MSNRYGWIILFSLSGLLCIFTLQYILREQNNGQVAAAAINPNPSNISFPYAGTVKVYYKIMPGTATNRVTLIKGATILPIDLPGCGGGCLGLIDNRITTFSVNAGDVVSVNLFNTNDNRTGVGWTDPTGSWICGTSGVGDGPHSFSDLESQVESNGKPILKRQCWEDATDSDFNDLVVIFTYDQVIYTTPTPSSFSINFLGIKLGKVTNPSIGGFQLPFCPVNIGLFNFWVLLPCIIPWTQ